MDWITKTFAAHTVTWVIISALISLSSGAVSIWVTYQFKRRELIQSARLEVSKQQELQAMTREKERQDRVRQEIIKWTNPILGAVESLRHRLENVIERDGYLALSKEGASKIDVNWSIDYDYFMPSTLYYFGQYFAWVQMLREELNFELFQIQATKDTFLAAIEAVTKALSHFSLNGSCPGQDTQVFRLQQRAIGELLIVRENGNRRCISYPDFLNSLSSSPFEQQMKPLKALLEGISPTPKNNCRWVRLNVTHAALVELETHCNALLRPPPSQGNEKRPQDQ